MKEKLIELESGIGEPIFDDFADLVTMHKVLAAMGYSVKNDVLRNSYSNWSQWNSEMEWMPLPKTKTEIETILRQIIRFKFMVSVKTMNKMRISAKQLEVEKLNEII